MSEYDCSLDIFDIRREARNKEVIELFRLNKETKSMKQRLLQIGVMNSSTKIEIMQDSFFQGGFHTLSTQFCSLKCR